jgi:hypothetical protein
MRSPQLHFSSRRPAGMTAATGTHAKTLTTGNSRTANHRNARCGELAPMTSYHRVAQ